MLIFLLSYAYTKTVNTRPHHAATAGASRAAPTTTSGKSDETRRQADGAPPAPLRRPHGGPPGPMASLATRSAAVAAGAAAQARMTATEDGQRAEQVLPGG